MNGIRALASTYSLAMRVGVILVGAGLLLLAARIGVGAMALLAGLAVLALTDRRLFVIAVAGSAPLATLGWTVSLATIDGRIFDVRLLLTFGVAALTLIAVAVQRGRPTILDAAFAGFIGIALLSGLLHAESALVWGPQVARFVSYAAIAFLARQVLTSGQDLRVAVSVVCVAFLVPTVMGVMQYLVGESSFLNGAVRATAPGDRGPIALAFDGQMVMIFGYALGMTAASPRARRIWVAIAAIGAVGLYASATRLVTVTGWAAVVAWEAMRRPRGQVAIIVVLGLASLLARPDLIGRFVSAIPPDPNHPPCDVVEEEQDCGEIDASLRFRFFVWDIILGAWREQPLLGIGPGMTAVLVAEVSPAERTAPHNDYIGILAETGVLGLSFYLGLQACVLLALLRMRRRTHWPTQETINAVVVCFVAVNILGALDNPIYFVDLQLPLWSLVGAATGLLVVPPDPQPGQTAETPI